MPVKVTDIGTGVVTATTTAVVTLEVKRYNQVALGITGLSAETIAVYVSLDGGANYSAEKLSMTPVDATAAATDLGNKTYAANLPACTHIKLVKSAGVSTAVVRYCLRQS